MLAILDEGGDAMSRLTTQVTCCTSPLLALVTLVVTAVTSVRKQTVWHPPEIEDMFQTTVGCTSNGFCRQDFSFAQTTVVEDTAPV